MKLNKSWQRITLLCLVPVCLKAESGEMRLYNSDFSTMKPFPEAKHYASIGVRLDCNHDFNRNPGDTQDCFSLTGLRLDLKEQFKPGLYGQLVFNPFASLSRHWDKRIDSTDHPLAKDSELGMIESFRVEWLARPRLAVGLELYEGATFYPDNSGLPYAAGLWDSGWKQTAVSVTYFLSMLEGSRVRFVGGNGEGEILRNSNPQRYFGFEFQSEVIRGVEVRGGMSTSGNQTGSESMRWSRQQYAKNCGITEFPDSEMGYSARRMSVSVHTNGLLSFARGLRVGLGWHKSLYSQIDKDKPSQPSISELENCSRLDPDLLFIEDPTQNHANTMEYVVTGINGSYRILDTWFLGFDYESRTISSDISFFQRCETYESNQCIGPAAAEKSLQQWAWSAGGGADLSEGLSLAFAYHSASFAHLYKKIYYEGRGGKASRSRDLFSVRFSYNWGS